MLEYATSGAAPTSPPEGVVRRMRHQEPMRAVGTHYGPTWIYGPTGHAIGGICIQALRHVIRCFHAVSVARDLSLVVTLSVPGSRDRGSKTTGRKTSSAPKGHVTRLSVT